MIDFLWDKDRKTIPWYDKMHWWLGRLLYVLAFIQIPVGIYVYNTINNESHIGTWIAYIAWSVVVILVLFLLNRKLGQRHHTVTMDE